MTVPVTFTLLCITCRFPLCGNSNIRIQQGNFHDDGGDDDDEMVVVVVMMIMVVVINVDGDKGG